MPSPVISHHVEASLTIAYQGAVLYHTRVLYIIPRDIIEYRIISYHITSYHIISYHIISYHAISYHVISYHTIRSAWYYIIYYHTIPCHTISYYHTVAYNIISHHDTKCACIRHPLYITAVPFSTAVVPSTRSQYMIRLPLLSASPRYRLRACFATAASHSSIGDPTRQPPPPPSCRLPVPRLTRGGDKSAGPCPEGTEQTRRR